MKKVLIWDLYFTLANTGGPAGYLYNIREYLNKNENKLVKIDFLKDVLGIPNIDIPMNVNHKKDKNLINVLYSGYYHSIKGISYWNQKIDVREIRNLDLNQYDVIHFHTSVEVYMARDIIKSYNGKIVLTSHSPQPASCETVSPILFKKSIIKYLVKEILLKKELEAWEYADYLMFPVVGAVEPYLKEDKMRKYKEAHPKKFIYCESAILDRPISVPLTRKELGIDESKILICYIGRHNEVKGYDALKLFAERILEKDDRFVFVIAGKEEPLKGLKHKNWIELGWINYGNRLVAGSDLFILPNKETYFDLVALEVMREGTPIFMTDTGGNKYFKEFGEEYGFYFYQYGDLDEQEEVFSRIVSEIAAKKIALKSKKIRTLFEEKFTIKQYIERYSNLILSITQN